MRSSAIALLVIAQVGCIGSSYTPQSRGTAKLTYEGQSATLVVGDRAEPIGPFDGDYVDLFQDPQAHAVADSAHGQRVAGFVLGLVGLVGTVSSFFILPDAADLVDLDSDRGKVAFGVLIGSAVVASVGSMFSRSADAKLNDAINIHNDRFFDAYERPITPIALPPVPAVELPVEAPPLAVPPAPPTSVAPAPVPAEAPPTAAPATGAPAAGAPPEALPTIAPHAPAAGSGP